MRNIKSETERPCARIRDLIQKVEASSTYERQQTCCPKLWPKINEKSSFFLKRTNRKRGIYFKVVYIFTIKIGCKTANVSRSPGIFVVFFSFYFFIKVSAIIIYIQGVSKKLSFTNMSISRLDLRLRATRP